MMVRWGKLIAFLLEKGRPEVFQISEFNVSWSSALFRVFLQVSQQLVKPAHGSRLFCTERIREHPPLCQAWTCR